ncbi:MAG: 3-hydroxyacyl-[acyl-carrier-protein] dehydratase FabZ [Betaproteobacteria bacterium]|nr:MAG: 3-hydroxyacyl-[acyl-carrier-protein] dehydratase FabZ [Betaproteobacteria bacterium]TAG44542.1 MAG: 3-hydroxyacyl-[acyl-carrier-protein] dehydratase FabZ [Betaproteobacteria bacterium]
MSQAADNVTNPSEGSAANTGFDIKRILQLLPHRYPFLLIDRVRTLEVNKRVTAYKNVSINEPFFNGHFPNEPVMPGVLIIEAMAQAAALLFYESLSSEDASRQRIVYLAGVDEARFKKMVLPGDCLEIEVSLDRIIRNIGKFTARATVDGKLAAEAKLIAALQSA